MKRILHIRGQNPLFLNKFIFDLSSTGKRHQELITRMHTFSHEIIKNRTDEFRQMSKSELEDMNNNYSSGKVKRQLAFLDTLLYAMDVSSEIDLTGVHEEVEVFMFAGHDTTTSTLAFALNFITEHQDVLHKCQIELSDVFGASDRNPTFEDLKKLKYLDACIKETLRMRPPVREYYREIPGGGTLEIKNIKYGIIPEATLIICDEFMHYNEKNFKCPFDYR